MDSASAELYFQKIQELVQDDDKIVTVSSLASNFGISVQNSRNLISKYLEDQRKLKFDQLAVTYVISGTLNNGKKGVFMAKETDLEEKRKLFDGTPWEVIYSVQKNKNVDFNIIALVDMFGLSNIRDTALDGSIISKNCVKRTLKFKKLPSPPPPTLKGKSSFFVPKAEASITSEKSTVSSKNEQKAKASGGIADLFKAATSKQKSGNGLTNNKSNKPAAKAGGLAGFFTNGVSKSPKATDNSDMKKEKDDLKTKSVSQNSIKKEEVVDVVDVEMDEEPVDIKKEIKTKDDTTLKNKVRQNNGREKKKGDKRQRDKSKEVPSKKRKRIIERIDSDSDDMFEKEDDSDDIIERSDEEPERVPSPVQKPVVPKNKRRKAITKNYKDEEGFVVTKMEYIYETASEDENVEPVPPKQEKKETKPVSKATAAAEKKKPAKNQATLMSFFKKK